jgi:S1-C subfamily serine protease
MFKTEGLPLDRNSSDFQRMVSGQLGLDYDKLAAGRVAVLHHRFTVQNFDIQSTGGNRDLGLWGSKDQGFGIVEYQSLPNKRGYLSQSDSVVRITKSLENSLENGVETSLEKSPAARADRASSGVFVTKDGKIATNEHVVRNAEELHVETHDGRTFTASVIGVDTANDLALLQVNGLAKESRFPVPNFSDLDTHVKNTKVAAVGHQGGLKGLVASPGQFEKFRDAGRNSYLMDSVVQGASGSPIFDHNGQLVGLAAKIYPNVPKMVTGPNVDTIRMALSRFGLGFH